jgi:translocation and assembly module TamB
VDFADGLALGRLRLGLDAGGSAELAGRLAPLLDLDASIRQLPLDLVGAMLPAPPVTGRLDADLRISGRRDDPVIGLSATADALRLSTGPARSLPPARVVLQATRTGGRNEVGADMALGAASRLSLRGRIGAGRTPAAGALDLRADGRLDLADLDSLLGIQGRQARGALVLDTRIGGVLKAPVVDGSLRIEAAAVHDRGLGLALTDIDGRLALGANALRIERLSGRAGRGSFSLSGRVGPAAEAIPVDLRLTAKDAEPLQGDRLQVHADADLSLRGEHPRDLTLAGRIDLHRLGIGLPERLPATVVSLPVRERGETRRPRPAAAPAPMPPADLRLAVEIAAPDSVELWGQGIAAELGGRLRLRGTLARPEAEGGFRLVRGDYRLLGQRLRFTGGRIDFDGAAGLIPSLDLEARVTAAGSTAILLLSGPATAPRVELRGEPELPRDEVLSRLLFGVAGARLSPWQVTQVGLAAASLAGVQVAGADLLGRTRERLGLEQLWIGAGERGTAILEGGRYIADGVYVGARQGNRAGETRGVLRVDLTPRLRLESDIGGRATRTGAAFEIEY